MELNFCTQCGKQLTYKSIGDEGEQKYCPDCNKFYFNNPASCVLVTIINENNQVLLLKQNYISAKNYTLCSGYVTAKSAEVKNEQLSAENEKLHTENQQLKDLNNAANAKYEQLDRDFADIYDSVADEIALRDENANLSVENGRPGNQLHSACGELKKVKTKNAALRTKVSEQEQQIGVLKAELSNLQRLYALYRRGWRRSCDLLSGISW